ncbi:MAG TPA: glycoside hydrolase family 3 N-terminal domain-containing protein [Bacteroidia bacterium]|jgi:beta-glucosidase-like glycosyl hydrolase/CubicO group peptidase (beta-lactamase class C family)
MKKTLFLILSFVSVTLVSFIPDPGVPGDPPFYGKNTRWADSVFKTLSPDERIAQLFMVAAYSNRDKAHLKEIKTLVDTYKIGGLIFFQGGPVRQAILSNCYQSCSKVPLLISMDAEWGLAMRLDSTTKFPRQMTLGAIQDDSLIYQMGVEIARQTQRLGMQVNFAPDIDINNNPLNPVIGSRSFGEDKYNVTRKSMMYMKGMQDNHVLACGKHFPGHGDTDSDSHKTLPTIKSSRARLDTLELFPFKELIKNGLGSMMVAHLSIPALDTTRNQASTLTKKIVTGLLQDTLGFKGLIFTDALNMKGVSKFYKPGEVDVKAVLAGNDVLLFPEDVPTGIREIKAAIERGELSQEEIDRRCMKILLVKQWAGLDKSSKVKLKNLYNDLNTKQAEVLNRKLTEASLTLLQNKNNIIPLQGLDTLRIASLSLGHKEINLFQSTLENYAAVTHFGIDKEAKPAAFDTVLTKLKDFNLVVIHINNTNNKPDKDFGLMPKEKSMISALLKQNRVIINVSANPYILSRMDSIHLADAIIMSYEDNDNSRSLAAQLIFGGVGASGRLPVTASNYFKVGTGMDTKPVRFKYVMPEEIGANTKSLNKIDSIAMKGIKDKVFPGCQILAAKDGKIFYQKSFGYHTYENKIKVKNTDVYDIASITKIASSTLSLMKLKDEGKVNPDERLCFYLPELEGTNKQNIIIREMMAHQSGLRDWIPFWTKTVQKTGEYKPGIYNKTQNDFYTKRVAENLFISKTYEDSIYKQINESPVKEPGKYLYSDLGYYYIKRIIEKQAGKEQDKYVHDVFYAPLGLTTMTYKPRECLDLNRIVPTEFDAKFRKQQVHGDVHDQGAAMLGGVGGHAGLFSNSNDLAVIMQLFMDNGVYGGKRYIDSNTVENFTKCQYCFENRRGLGFDKPEMTAGKESPVCLCVAPESFGHAGFTGTLAWADPVSGIVYIFLSNRVYPDAEDNKLSKSGIRGKVHQLLYDAFKL